MSTRAILARISGADSNACDTSRLRGIDATEPVPQTGGKLLQGEEGLGMSTYPPPPPPGPGGVGRRLEEAVELIEMELRHAVAYVNDAVIPQVRRESITAMRTLSDTLRNLADRMERSSGAGPAGEPPSAGRDPRS